MITRILASILCALSMTTAAVADEFDRRGWYVGANAGAGFDFLSSVFDDATNGIVDIRPTGSFNARAGYRVFSWFAVEGMYEGVYGLSTEVAGVEVSTHSFHSLFVNGKLIVPTWRLQPYFILGVGAQYGIFDGSGFLEPLDLNRGDFAIRVGLGLDAYVTDNWVVNLELAPSARFADYAQIPKEITDNVTLTFTGGVQYRF